LLFRFGSSDFEFFHPSRSIYKFFFAGVEGVAVAADFHVDFFFCRSNNKYLPASAADFGISVVLWMSIFLHDFFVEFISKPGCHNWHLGVT